MILNRTTITFAITDKDEVVAATDESLDKLCTAIALMTKMHTQILRDNFPNVTITVKDS